MITVGVGSRRGRVKSKGKAAKEDWKCPKCSMTFTRESNMLRHARAMHGIGGPPQLFRCKMCKFKTKWKHCLTKHYESVCNTD